MYGSVPVAAATACSGSGISKASRRRSMRDPRSRRHVAEIGQQTVGDVDHGRGPGPRGRGAGAVLDDGHPVGLDDGARGPESPAQHHQSGRGPTQPAGHGHPSPARAPERSTGPRPSNSPSTVTEIVMSRDRVTSPPTRLTPAAAHSCFSPVGELQRPSHLQGRPVRRTRPADAGGPGADRLDVGHIDRHRLATDVVGPATSRAGNAPPRPAHRPRWRPACEGQHRGIVTRADQYVRRQDSPAVMAAIRENSPSSATASVAAPFTCAHVPRDCRGRRASV